MITYSELSSIYDIYKDGIWNNYIISYKQILGDLSERYSALLNDKQQWRTNISMPITQEIFDSMFCNIIDTNMGYEVDKGPGTNTSKAEAKVVKAYLNYIMEETKVDDTLIDVLKDAVLLGNGYFEVAMGGGEVFETTYFDGKKNKKAILKKLKLPTIRYANPFSLLIDPTAKSLTTARWICKRNFLHYGEIYDRYKMYFKDMYKSEAAFTSAMKALKTNPIATSSTSKLADRQASLAGNQQVVSREDYSLIKHNILLRTNLDQQDVNMKISPDDESLEVMDVSDRKGNVVIYIDGNVAYKGRTVYPFGGYQYETITYDRLTGTFLGVGIGHKVKELQELANIFLNIHVDNSKLAATPAFQQVVAPGSNLFEQSTELDVKPMKLFKVEQPNAITPLNLSKLDNLTADMGLVKELAMGAVGVSEMVSGTQSKVERSAAGVNALVNAFKARMRPLYKSVVQAMESAGYKMLMLTLALNSADEYIPIREEMDDGTFQLSNLKISDLDGQWKVIFEVAGLSTSMREIERKQLQEIIPIANQLIDPTTKQPIFNIRKIAEKLAETYGWGPNMLSTNEELQNQKNATQQDQVAGAMGVAPSSTSPALSSISSASPMSPTSPTSPASPQGGADPFAAVMDELMATQSAAAPASSAPGGASPMAI